MGYTDELLRKRGVAPLIEKEAALAAFESEIYGTMPPRPDHLRVELLNEDRCFAAGNAVYRQHKFTLSFGDKEFSFKVNETAPKTDIPCPAFVHIDTSSAVPSRFTPYEEICDGGFAVFSVCAFDLTEDNADFRSKIAKYFGTRRRNNATGKLIMWAYAAMRVMDYIEKLEHIDKNAVAVIGNELMGKASLLAGVYDPRFAFVISNCSGIFGASLTKGNTGEHLTVIADSCTHLFAPSLGRQLKRYGGLPSVDQHQLLALIAPRHLLLGYAAEDHRTDLEGGFLAAAAASPAYEKLGVDGLIHGDCLPKENELLADGRIVFYTRDGINYLSRRDWQVYMETIRNKIEKQS